MTTETLKSQIDIRVSGSGSTHIGQVRAVNQDSFAADDGEHFYMVADGMGGHAGGEIASQLCVAEVGQYLRKQLPQVRKGQSERPHPDPKLAQILTTAINFASTKIYERALEDPGLRGMGTTATVCQVVGSTAYVGHVGDSRLYLVRTNLIFQITHDHSLVSEKVRAGLLTQEEADQHHLRNVITRSVGYQEEEDVDTLTVDLEPGDHLLLCSDGLHGKVGDQEISQHVSKLGSDAVDALIDLANDRGGDDNITVVIFSCTSAS